MELNFLRWPLLFGSLLKQTKNKVNFFDKAKLNS